MGNAGVLLRAYIYIRLLGMHGMHRISEFATLNANYLMAELSKAGFEIAYPTRRASHEFIVTLKDIKDKTGVTAMNLAKRLLDKGYHAPTTYFPMLVPECLLIEPAETESKETLDAFVKSMKEILQEIELQPDLVKARHTPCRCVNWMMSKRRVNWIWPGSQAPDQEESSRYIQYDGRGDQSFLES